MDAVDRNISSSSHILDDSVNDLKTTFRDGIAIERAIVRVEAHRATARRANLHEIDRLNLTLRDLTRHAKWLHLGASYTPERVERLHSAELRRSLRRSAEQQG